MDVIASRKAKASFLSLQIVAATLSSVVSDTAHDCKQLVAYKKFDGQCVSSYMSCFYAISITPRFASPTKSSQIAIQ
jgi:hypothetical protein